jgi:small subunit ribosomal protein S16
MLMIRLTRVGKKNQPAYRVVLTEKTNPVRGKFQEILGNYNPRLKTKVFDAEKIKYWISKGAQLSPTVHNLLISEKIIEGKKVKAWHPKKKTQEAKADAAKAAEEAKAQKVETPASVEAPADKPAEEVNEESKVEEAKNEETKAE